MGWQFLPHTEVTRRRGVKDARINLEIAKRPAKGRANMGVKRTGRHKGDPQARQAANEVALVNAPNLANTDARERSTGMTERDPSTTPPVRTDNRVDPTWRSIASLPERLRFTNTTPFRATGKSGHQYEITWSRIRNAYIVTVDGETRCFGRMKVEAIAAANEIELNLPDPPENTEGAE